MKAAKQTSSVKNVLKELKENESSISMVLGGLVVLVVGVLLFNYFKNPGTVPMATPEPQEMEQGIQYEQTAEGVTVPKNLAAVYVVAAGDNLWKIAEANYGSGYNWVDIAKANKLSNASVLHVGKELSLPKVAVRELTGAQAAVNTPKSETTMTKGGEVAGAIADDTYTVAKGDHLWNIAVRAYGDGYAWSKIWNANKTTIKNPSSIEVGMKLTLPR